TYDQVTVQDDIIGDLAAYLAPEMKVKLSMHEGVTVAIALPPRATLEVVETEPTIKSQTAASSYKPAMLSNGVRTMGPPFVTTGTKIVVMTADGSYVERAKDCSSARPPSRILNVCSLVRYWRRLARHALMAIVRRQFGIWLVRASARTKGMAAT